MSVLPDLPTTEPVTVTGRVRLLHGHPVLMLDYTAPVGPSRGRRFRVDTIPATHTRTRVVFGIGGRAALRPLDNACTDDGAAVRLRMRALPPGRTYRVPKDLLAALQQAGLSLKGMSDSEAQQLVSMVLEARDPEIRSQRISAAVAAVAAHTGAQP